MVSTAGDLADSHDLSALARQYAQAVISGNEWPLTSDHVDLGCVTFETSTRLKRKHGVCISDGGDRCTIRLSKQTYECAGFGAIQETIRHELVHVLQYQDDDLQAGHGASFKRWVDPLDLSGRCSQHYSPDEDDYNYTFHCANCGFIGGRYRMCKTVRAAVDGRIYCQQCDSSDIEVRTDDRGLTPEDLNYEAGHE